MPYMIDGHNLLGQLRDISLDDANDEALLVQKLTSFAARTGKHCVVIFDYGLPGGKSRMSTRAVQVVFASQRSSADRVMLERIGKLKDPRNWTAVSSDNEVINAARIRRMQVLNSLEFADLLQSPPKREIDAGEAENIHLSAEEVDEWLDFFKGTDQK
jgi:predicted RNA-binding protein with PIN domain